MNNQLQNSNSLSPIRSIILSLQTAWTGYGFYTYILQQVIMSRLHTVDHTCEVFRDCDNCNACHTLRAKQACSSVRIDCKATLQCLGICLPPKCPSSLKYRSHSQAFSPQHLSLAVLSPPHVIVLQATNIWSGGNEARQSNWHWFAVYCKLFTENITDN